MAPRPARCMAFGSTGAATGSTMLDPASRASEHFLTLTSTRRIAEAASNIQKLGRDDKAAWCY